MAMSHGARFRRRRSRTRPGGYAGAQCRGLNRNPAEHLQGQIAAPGLQGQGLDGTGTVHRHLPE